MSRPFLKWAGGKHRVVDEFLDIVSTNPPLSMNWEVKTGQRYHEPFLGSGAAVHDMQHRGLETPQLVSRRRRNEDEGDVGEGQKLAPCFQLTICAVSR